MVSSFGGGFCFLSRHPILSFHFLSVECTKLFSVHWAFKCLLQILCRKKSIYFHWIFINLFYLDNETKWSHALIFSLVIFKLRISKVFQLCPPVIVLFFLHFQWNHTWHKSEWQMVNNTTTEICLLPFGSVSRETPTHPAGAA